MLSALTGVVLKHRRWVFLFWTVLLVAGGALASRAVDALSFDTSLPGQPGYETHSDIVERYGNGGSTPPLIPVVTVPAGSTVTAHQAAVDDVFATVQRDVPGVRVLDYAGTHDPMFRTEDGRSAYALVFTPAPHGLGPGSETEVRPVLERAAAAHGLHAELTGYPVLAGGAGAEERGVLAETLVGAGGALLVLAAVFGSLLALVPLVMAAVAITSTFLIVLLLTSVTDISFIVQFLVSLVGLGVAIDYSLLVVTRWREERANGRDNEEAVRVAMRTAGHAVLSSAGTVAISLMALIAIPVPFLRSMGLGGMLVPLVSAAVAVTLLPALLAGVGPRVDWPRRRRESTASPVWTRWSAGVVRHRWAAAIVAVGALGALLVPVFDLEIGAARSDSLATGGPAYESLGAIRDGGAPAGVVTPLEVLVSGGDPEAVARAAGDVPGVAAAFAPAGPAWRIGDATIVSVIPAREVGDTTTGDVVERVHDAVDGLPGVTGVAGQGALVLDYVSGVYGSFPLALALIVLLTFAQLVRAFRSLLLAVKAVLLNLLSVAATFGAVVAFWQYGYGSEWIFGIAPTGSITFWVPLVIFAFLFGLSMDYEVFIMARMREEYDASGSTTTAVITGMARTGRLVTSAALILFLAFVALSATPGTDVKIFASALGMGILLDATIVRGLLVPALVALMGTANWWLPARLGRLLRVAPTPPSEPAAQPHPPVPPVAAAVRIPAAAPEPAPAPVPVLESH